jgi:hypothetical protein
MANEKPDSTEISMPEVQARTESDIPQQTEFYKLPTRFGAVPVDEAPLGWEEEGPVIADVWENAFLSTVSDERIDYPTQKPEALLEKVIEASSREGDVVADFFCGGGTTPAVAQRLNRRWVACDQSRIAVAVTADRIARVVEEKIGTLFPVPDFTVEHWGIYESPKPEKLLSFIQPLEVRIAHERIGKWKYHFDVSESVSLNKDGIIANVQWDFDYRGRFSSTEGFAFLRDKKTGKPVLVVEYEFPSPGKKQIACSVQDDQGGERTVVMEVEVR